MVGEVKWFNDKKGYGFIIFDNKEAFIHYSQIIKDGYKTLKEQQKVIIGEIIETNKGYQAKKVEIM